MSYNPRRRRPRFALFLGAMFLLLALAAPRAEAGAICALRAATEHPCFDNPLHPDPDLPSYKAGNESGLEAGAPIASRGRGAGHDLRILDWPRPDDDHGFVCTVYELAYLARHGARRTPSSLRLYRGCSRWEHDFDYHNRGELLPRGGLLG